MGQNFYKGVDFRIVNYEMEVSMKLKTLILGAILTLFTSSAFAQFFPARVNVSVLPLEVSAQVFNPYYEPIVCAGQVIGQPYVGLPITTFFPQQIIPAGAFRVVFVNAYPQNPFVSGWANIQCQFARFW